MVNAGTITVSFKLTRLGRALLRAHHGRMTVTVLTPDQAQPSRHPISLKLATGHARHKR
jgi:hypothetical protein